VVARSQYILWSVVSVAKTETGKKEGCLRFVYGSVWQCVLRCVAVWYISYALALNETETGKKGGVRIVFCSVLQGVLRCVAVCCRVLQCGTSRGPLLPLPKLKQEKKGRCEVRVLQSVSVCVAVCCSVLQCVAVCCRVLQCGTSRGPSPLPKQKQGKTGRCEVRVRLCVAVCCSVLQCVAVWYISWSVAIAESETGKNMAV